MLAMPPKATAEMAKGFTLYMLKAAGDRRLYNRRVLDLPWEERIGSARRNKQG
jgi:hypothetical protein